MPGTVARAALGLAALGLSACNSTWGAGAPLEHVEVSPLELDAALEPPDAPPQDLAWRTAPARLLVRRPGLRGTAALWVRALARPGGARDPVILIPKAYVTLAAYVDGRRVYSRSNYRDAAGMPYHVVPLPEGRREVEVTFRLASRYTQVGFPDAPRAGERAALIEGLVRRDTPRLALAVAFLLASIVSLLLASRTDERRALIGIGTFTAGMGGWSLFQSKSHALFLDDGAAWFGIWWVGAPLVTVGAALFVDAVFGPGPARFARWIWIAGSVVAGGALVSLFAGFDVLAPAVYIAGRGLGLVGVLTVALYVGVLAWRGNVEARIFLAGFALGGGGAVHDIAVSFDRIASDALYMDFGYAMVGLALVLIVRRRLVRADARMAAYAASLDRFVRERDALTRDLHDGIGGVVTNLRLLAERGRAQGAGDQARTLDVIASLAGEGMAELRTLMLGFDALPETWRAAAAELRRTGAVTLEPHGIEHAFEAAIDEGAPSPELALFVEVCRVHREALTNAIKHAGARRVEVRLAVTAGALLLAIRDDGRGLGDRPETGRGLPSMKARARRLRGLLEVGPAPDGGTRVTLEVPLA